MATYVFSDVHGHGRALDELLLKISPSDTDTLYFLGDMIDRGPDAVLACRLIKDLKNVHVLMGNHEYMMLNCLTADATDADWSNWLINGGDTTVQAFSHIAQKEVLDIIDWMQSFSYYQVLSIYEHIYILVHAGIRASSHMPKEITQDSVSALMSKQAYDDLLWIREDFWQRPTGLLQEDGTGAIVIAGHTPTPYVAQIADRPSDPVVDDDGHALILEVGASQATGGVSDRIAVDCAAASGAGMGQVGMLRLDDYAALYVPIKEGE